MEDFVSSFVTPTPEHEYEDELGDNVRTCLASDCYVVITSSSEPMNTDVSTSFKVTYLVPYVQTKAEAMTAGLVRETRASSAPGNKTETSSSTLGDASPASFRNQIDAEFLDQLNANSAQPTCMVYELCLWYEHEITVREKFEKKFMKSADTIQQRDAKIAGFKSRLKKTEREVAEVIRLRGRVSEVEAMAAAKVEELASLGAQNADLLGKVSGLESVHDGLKEQVL
ncbi:hypothetical protein Tco_0627281 [Tanacetum coccineum]|uniref:Uncharacterized protein n=1 Tax=Tanacetum coccineum TaxID=301880 RepID=A0ABQ4WM04_9ASTR